MDSPRRFVSSPAYPLRRKESTEPRCGKKRRRDLGILRPEKSIDHTGLSTFTQPRHESKFHRQHVRFSMKSEIQQSFDTDLTRQDVQDLSSADAVTAFFARLGYDTGTRTPQPLAISELPQTARPRPIKKIELIANHKRACFRSTCSSFRALRSGTRERWRERFGIAREIICWP